MGLDIIGLVRMGMNLAVSLTPDVQKTVTYRRRKTAVYTPESGTVAQNEIVATGITAIVTTYSESEVDGESVQLGDERVIIRFKDLMLQNIANVGVEDVLDDEDGVRREVVDFKLDPTQQCLQLQCRQVGS